jgi:hypothetical protein
MVGNPGSYPEQAIVGQRQLGNLKLTDQEDDLLVAFLKTDGYKLPSHQRRNKFSYRPPFPMA